MKKDLQIVIPLREYEELLEYREQVIQTLGDLIAQFRRTTLKFTDLMDTNKVEYREIQEYKDLMELLNKHITYKKTFLGFNKEGKLILNNK